MPEMQPIVEIDALRRGYATGADVLNEVSFDVEPGQVVALLGRNGAGKTTLIRCLLGMLEAQGGAVRLFGLDPREQPVEVKRRLGYVAEDQILPPFFRVREIIDLHRGLFPTWDDELAERLGKRFLVPPEARIKQLSKGQARQVALLCAVAHRPELLLLDEPAGGLDPAARRNFLETSIELLNEAGTTILFSSHHMSDVERMADRVVMLAEGQVRLDSAMDALRERYALALVPCQDDSDVVEQLKGVEGCLVARRRMGTARAVFALEPDACEARVRAAVSERAVRVTSVGLEEMFIELLGD